MTDEGTTETPETTEQESPGDTDWKARSREWEARAKANKTAADELAALRGSQKTLEQTFEDRLSEMEKRASDAESKALRSDIAAKFGISPADRDLFLIGNDESTLTAQAERLAAREQEKKTHGNVAPREGTTTPGGTDPLRAFTRDLFGTADN